MNVLTWTGVQARQATGVVLRQSRRLRGWKVVTYIDFQAQCRIAAAQLERHPHLRTVWKLGRNSRIQTINVKMQEVLQATCGEAVVVDCMCDGLGAIGEVHMGYWVADFRIELDPRRQKLMPKDLSDVLS